MPRKGEVWAVNDVGPRAVLVISGDMYNDLPDWPYVLTMEAIKAGDAAVSAPIMIPIGADEFVLIDSIRRTAKPLFDRLLRKVDGQAVSDVHNALFQVLSTT